MVKPKLRFPEFTDSYTEVCFGDIFEEYSETTSDIEQYPLYSLTIERGVISKPDRYIRSFLITKETDSYKIVPPKAFVYNPMNLRFGALKVCHEKFPVAVSQYYNVFGLKDDEIIKYWENYLTTTKMLNYYFSIATGSLVEKLRVHYSQFITICKSIPSRDEQIKIGKFVDSIENMISTQEEIVKNLNDQKKSLIHKIFSQEIRFKAVDGSEFPEWVEKRFLDVFEFQQNNTFSRNELTTDKLNVMNIHYGDVLVKYNNIVDCEQANLPYIIDEVSLNKYKCESYIQSGDIIIVDTAEDMTVGKAVEIINVNSLKILSGLHTMLCRPKSKFISKYLGYFLNSKVYHNQLNPLITGIKVSSISKSNISDTVIIFPCLEEQLKIVNCLSTFDTQVDNETAILENWKVQKKALLQQMFV
jgi:type I restriction enzyme S subunit